MLRVLCLDWIILKLTMNFQYGYVNISIADKPSQKHTQNLHAIRNILLHSNLFLWNFMNYKQNEGEKTH